MLYEEITTNRACEELVELRFQHAYQSVETGPNGSVDLTVHNVESDENETISCSHVIAADGAYSSVREDLREYYCCSRAGWT